DFGMRLLARLHDYDVVGVIGGTQVTGPLASWAGHPHLRGWITHHVAGKSEWDVDILDPRPFAGEVRILDGVLLAARREVFAAVRFDAVTFDGFHGYDIDWSYRAALAGFRVGVAGDLLLVHASRGKYDEVWEQYADRFCLKHGVCHNEPAAGPFYRTTLTSAA